MAKCVVDVFEIVQIEKEQGQFLPVSLCAAQGPFRAVTEQRAVWQTGQAVVISQLVYLLFRALPV